MIDLGVPLVAREGLAVLDPRARFRHLYVLGATGTGKTTFLANLFVQERRHAVIVLDPVGSLAEAVAALAPAGRLTYVDKDHPIVINPLDRAGLTKSQLASELGEVINACVRATTSTQETTILHKELIRNAVLALPADRLDIKEVADFLNYEPVRRKYFETRTPPVYWQYFDDRDPKTRQLVSKEKIDGAKRVGARLSAFYEDESLRPFLIGPNQLDIAGIARARRIVVFNLFGLGSEAIVYLGNLVTHAIKSYFHYQATPDSPPLFLYVDEFQSFVTEFFDVMLAQARKFNISLTLAHQSHLQISKETLSAILGNCYAKVVFNCGSAEARRMAEEYQLRPEAFLKLSPYEAYVQIGKAAHKVLTFPPPKVKAGGQHEAGEKEADGRAKEKNGSGKAFDGDPATPAGTFLRDCWFRC